MKIAIIVVAVIVVGVGAWLVYDNSYSNDNSNTYQTVNNYNSANYNTNKAANANQASNVNSTNQALNANVATTVDYTINMDEYSFSRTSLQVAQGGSIQVKLKNVGVYDHAFVIDELGVDSGVMAAGAEKMVTITGSQAGTFKFYCKEGTHQASGMEGTIVVTGQ